MRTLKEEIAYCQKEGFHRNTVELNVMLFWLGELTMLELRCAALQEVVDRRNQQELVAFGVANVEHR